MSNVWQTRNIKLKPKPEYLSLAEIESTSRTQTGTETENQSEHRTVGQFSYPETEIGTEISSETELKYNHGTATDYEVRMRTTARKPLRSVHERDGTGCPPLWGG